jgi:SM-20-related protein
LFSRRPTWLSHRSLPVITKTREIPWLPASKSREKPVPQPQQPIEEARSLLLQGFLAKQELSGLMDYARLRARDFHASQVVANAEPAYQRHRRSRVLLDAGTFHEILEKRIKLCFYRILQALNHPFFHISRVESQITASNDGDYFRLHNDNTHGCAPSREITFVYFFHREPKPFEGGELILYDSCKESGGSHVPVRIRRRITPSQNAIIFFQSSCIHEILPVQCPTGLFSDSRFTLNGWVHR